MKLSEIYNWYSELETVTAKKSSLNTLRVIRKYVERLNNPTIRCLTIQMVVNDRLKRVKTSKPTTSNSELSHLRAMLGEAVMAGLIKSNPIKDIKLLACDNIRMVDLRPSDVDRLVKHCPDWLGKIVIILSHMPCRKSEITGLQWSEIDFSVGDSGILRLPPLRTKNGKGRVIPLHPKVRDILRSMPSRFQGGFVFQDQALIRRSISYEFGKARKAAGMPEVRLHDLRHLAISEMFRAGIDQFRIMKLAGHNSESLFFRYCYLEESDLYNLSWG